MTTIPMNFCDYNYNRINLTDHTLIYSFIGWREGRTEHTTKYRQKVTVITADGRKESRFYTQRGDEFCRYRMHDEYEYLCKKLNITPCGLE